MEVIIDIIKAFSGGIVEILAENKLSEKRREYFSHKKGKWAKICFWVSLILALVLVIMGLIQIIQKKMIGILLFCIGMGIGLSMAADWGASKR